MPSTTSRRSPACAAGGTVSDHDDVSRRTLSELFTTWQGLLAGVLNRLQDHGVLAADAPVGQLATGLMTALQGGYMPAHLASLPVR